MEYYCDTDKYLFNSGQYSVNYDPAVLQLNEESNMIGQELNVFPITNGGGIFSFDSGKGNFTHPTGYDLVDETGKAIPVVRLVFDVVGSGSTEVELTVEAQACSPVGDPNTWSSYIDNGVYETPGHKISDMERILTDDGAKIDTNIIPNKPAPRVINGMRVTVTEPEPGKAPDYYAVVPAGCGYAVDSEDGVMWFNESNLGAYMAPDSGYVFEPNQEYKVMITLVTVRDRDTFASSDRRATLNDMEVGFSDYGRDRDHMVYIEGRFICAPEGGAAIREVEVGTDEPSDGEKPYYYATVDSDRYSISDANDSDEEYISGGIGWYNVTEDRNMRYTDRFEWGKTYRWSILLQSDEFPFAPADEISATFNGRKASVKRITDRSILLWVDLKVSGVPTVIDSVAITIPEPAAGEKPSFTATVPDGAGYCLESRSDNFYHDGILWVRCSDWHYLEPGVDTFEEGEEYNCNMRLTTVSDKYVFADSDGDLNITINGHKAITYYRYSDNRIDVINDIDQPFTVSEAGSAVSGSFTSYLDASGTVTVQLLQSGSVQYSATATGNSGSYAIENVADGSYTLRVSKANHVTRDYAVTVSGDTTQDVKICPLGDVDGNGKVQANDAMKAYQHAQGKADAQLTGYAFQCVDVAPVGEPNDKVQAADAMVIYQQAQGKHSLW